MKSSCKKEDTDIKKKYVFFSDPDIIVQRAENSAAAAQVKQDLQFQQQQGACIKQSSTRKSTDLPIQFDLKGLENLLSYHPVQPYPFTFISAVKRKLALGDSSDSCKKAYEPREKTESQPSVAILKTKSARNLYQVVEKMDFIRPLKVPDLKITPKTLDFSSRENSMSKELTSGKFEPPSKEIVHERAEKKGFERVQRKLDFSGSDGPSMINSDIIGPLKMPNISIATNLSKKKEHIRENSREKENRSKRIKKDDCLYGKQDEAQQDIFKRSKSPRHISRKELGDNLSDTSIVTKLKGDRMSFHIPRESDFASTKAKTKSFATSTAKKDTDKKHRSLNIRSLKLTRDNSADSRSRTCSNESLSERSMQLPDKITTRETSRNIFENAEYRYKDDFHLLKQGDEQKHIFPPESRQGKQQKSSNQIQGKLGSSVFKEQTKRISEKGKPSTSKPEMKSYILNSEESGDIETITEPNVSLHVRSPSTGTSMQQTKSKESEKAVQSAQSINLSKSSKTVEDSKCTDDSLQQCMNASIKKEEQSFTQTISTPTKQTSTTNESKDSNESTISEALLDPRRISFRDDSRLQQPEFCDLVTPDMNLLLRSKRKKQLIQSNNSETDIRRSKYAPMVKMETEQESIQLLHPSALHLQFQAELHLLDSFDESLRQVMDVEKCLYNVKRDHEKHMQSVQQSNTSKESKIHSKVANERGAANSEPSSEISKFRKHTTDKAPHTSNEMHHTRYTSPVDEDKIDNNPRKLIKPVVKAVEVQTQTANDIATQTDARSTRCSIQGRCPDIRGITYERGAEGYNEIPELSLDSAEQFEDLDQIEEISLPSKLRTMSEISLHETTSSIRTETGTEISISTRDVTCSFNKYLDLEIAQLIKDEKQRYDKIEMLFKSREKTLNDRTKKLVKLEEQKRALRDTGQDSRISSVKKKQRALLLKLQQEKDEMNRLKELHKIASQERKLMLQKQRNMFNPQMSTKNILTKLKRSADSQSPRRLSGPMKGYDIRSNSSMSSLVDSDKSQHDRSQADTHLQISEGDLHFSKIDLQKGDKFINFVEESNTSLSRFDKSNEGMQADVLQDNSIYKSPKENARPRYEIKSRNFEEKMPRSDDLRLKSHQFDVESKLISGRSVNKAGQYLFEKEKSPVASDLLQQNLNKSVSENAKSESDTLVEEFSKKSKPSQSMESHYQNMVSPRERDSISRSIAMNTETIQEEINFVSQDSVSKTSKSSQVSEDILQTLSKSSKKSSKSISTDKDMSKKTQYNSESKSSSKRKSSKCQKSKSSSSILTENILRSKSNSQMSEEFIKHHNKRTKVEKEFVQSDKKDDSALLDNIDLNVSENTLQALVKHTKGSKDKSSRSLNDMAIDCESKENMLCQKMHERNLGTYEKSSQSQQRSVQNVDNVSAKSEVSTFAVSHHSSGESERNYSKSVVVRSQDQDFKTSKKLEQILNAREAALASRKNCVEEWMAWHAKLRAEEDRVARMEQAALKLVTATSSVFSQQDTTVSSDTSDVEGRIELLTEKLAERRIEMSRLKREARKQTKQKLRALEANLLTQIKKYDTTIHEMRKKLETKKGVVKDNDKLAIESKSLADFKVPEIPLKRIRDIYKSSDLLRSRSESDLLSTKGQSKDVRSIGSMKFEAVEEKFERSRLQKLAKDSKSVHSSEHLSSIRLDTINQSIQSIFDECISEQIECDKIGSASISSTSDEAHSDKHNLSGSKAYSEETRSKRTAISEAERITAVPSQDSISEDIQTEISTAKSETGVITVSGSRLSRNDSSVQSELMEQKVSSYASVIQSQQKSISVQSGIEEVQDSESTQDSGKKSQQNSEKSNAEVKTPKSTSEILDFSKKLDFLRLNNKNLNDDLSSLENELKALSDMVSRFNAKSKETSKTELQVEDKSTSKDISEVTFKSERDDQTSNLEIRKTDRGREFDVHSTEFNSEISDHLTNSAKLKLSGDFSNNKDIVENVDDVISVIIPNDEISLSKSNQEIDYEARTKEIMNEIEKSIISEHIKTAEYDSNRSRTLFESNTLNSHKDGDDLSNQVLSSDANISSKRMSEIYSEVISGKESVNKLSNIPEDVHDSAKVTSIHESFSAENANLLAQDLTALNSFKSPDRSSRVSLAATKTNLENSINTISNKVLDTLLAEQSSISDHILELSRAQSPEPILHIIAQPEPVKTLAQTVQENDTHRSVLSTTEHVSFTSCEHKNKLDTISHMKSKCDEHVALEDIQRFHKFDASRNNEDIKQDTLQPASSFIADEISKDENRSEFISTGKVSLDKEDWTISDSFDVKQDIQDTEQDQSENQHLQSYSGSSSNFSDTRNESQPFDDTKLQEENLASDIEVSLFIPKGESTNIETYGIKFDESTLDSHDVKRNDDLDDILDIITKDDDKKQLEYENIQTSEVDEFNKAIQDSVTKILDKVEKSIETSPVGERIDFHVEEASNEAEVETVASNDNKSDSSSPILNLKWQDEQERETDANNVEENCPSISDDIHEEKEIDDQRNKSLINVSLHVEVADDEGTYHASSKLQEIVITELEPGSVEGEILPELQIDAKIELAEEDSAESIVLTGELNSEVDEDYGKLCRKEEVRVIEIEAEENLEPITEQDSSDGEQLDNLVEVAESGLDVIEKKIEKSSLHSASDAKSILRDDEEEAAAAVQDIQPEELAENKSEKDDTTVSVNADSLQLLNNSDPIKSSALITINNKTFDILKDPEYEDISEESLEVSEILDKSDAQKSASSQKSSGIPEKYQATHKSDEVLRILDEIAQRSLASSESTSKQIQLESKQTGDVDDKLEALTKNQSARLQPEGNTLDASNDGIAKEQALPLAVDTLQDRSTKVTEFYEKETSPISIDITEERTEASKQQEELSNLKNKSPDEIYRSEEKVSEKQEQDASSDSSEGAETPRGVSEIEIDSPRDLNDSKLDVDSLNDDLLNSNNAGTQSTEQKSNYHAAPIVGTSEKDIEVMIDKLKASLGQPGLEVAELEAKLLRIEQLQIELEIKKLEAEEVSYYVREIPNKPPPPYTPPGGGARISTSLASPSPPPAVIPSNVDELTAFTEKATALIFNAKQAGEDIMSLEAPPEIYALTKETNETVKKDRRIYNTFLFDLCKETIAEIYRAEYEKPGPSWTKPNVKTKPIMKIPKTVEELNEYVSKEVATLFGFKTKLQRENMVMRWSRKRRDRVDELLAREAQAEEDEWTKFHHDELAVKNGLTVAILDSLIMETVNVVKVAYAKKRKIMI